MLQETNEAYSKLVGVVDRVFGLAKSDRQYYETKWVTNHLQYRGKYDNTVTLLPGRSRVYPRDTRVKVEGFVAKMMELMFPASENNFTFQPSPVPDIPREDLQRIMQQVQDPKEVREAVMAFAQERADAMTTECEDQLQELDWTQMCKSVLRSGAKYGLGVARGPDVIFKERKYYLPDPVTGLVSTQKEDYPRPFFDAVNIWRAYPDFSARVWEDQQFFFEEVVLTRPMLYALAKRTDFRGKIIRDYLRDHTTGTYRPAEYESKLYADGEGRRSVPSARQYMVRRNLLFVAAKYLRDIPGMVDLPTEDEEDVFVDVWTIDGFVIKAVRPPLGERPSDLYHGFIYLGDEESPICGVGMPENLRDSQMQVCAASRALMDNTAAVAGPIVEVNEALLAAGEGKKQVRSFTTFRRDDMGADGNIPAIRNVSVDSHIQEILAVLKYQREVLDVESMLPSWLMGQTQQLGEAFRTTSNMSAMQGGANLFAKDTVRAFDKFIKSMITSLYNWNMEFNDKPEIKGDYDVIPRGTVSLLAREIRGMALDQLATTLSPEDRALIDTREMLIERIKSRDLPTKLILSEQQAAAAQQSMQQQATAAQQIEQSLTAAKAQQASAAASKLGAEAMAIGMKAPVEAQSMANDSTANAIASIGGMLNDGHQIERSSADSAASG